MNTLAQITGSYCKIALINQESTKGIVQSGFVKKVDDENKIVILENENGVVRLPFHHIRAVKKITGNENR